MLKERGASSIHIIASVQYNNVVIVVADGGWWAAVVWWLVVARERREEEDVNRIVRNRLDQNVRIQSIYKY